jgi:predicted metal-dependent peptidase
MRAPSPKIVVAIDTSGSMGGDDLVAALREVRGILQAMRCPLELVSCDAHVNAIGRVTRIEDVPALLKGGGGTNFRPVFELLEKEHPQPEIVIYMTDGDGRYPEKPGWTHVIWVLVGSYVKQPPWGDVVRVEEDSK